MFTECPECQTAFRVTALLLKQARGQVRCGDCGHTFDALDHLSEEMPAADSSSSQSINIFEQRSRALLQSLDELSGGEDGVRIEDTGVEWRVLDMDDDDDDDVSHAANNDNDASADAGMQVNWPAENTVEDELPYVDEESGEEAEPLLADGWLTEDGFDEPAPLPVTEADEAEPVQDDDTPQAADGPPDAESGPAAGQLRFDDNTPLPDEFYRPVSESDAAPEGTPADDAADIAAEENLRVAIDTGTPADWKDLLEEVDETASPATDQATGDELQADAAAREDATEARDGDDVGFDDSHDPGDDEPADSAAVDEAPVAASADESDESVETVETDETDVAADADANDADQPHEPLTATASGDTTPPSVTADDDVTDDTLAESIVMEGDTVTDLLEKVEAASFDNVPPPELDDDESLLSAAPRREGRSALGLFVGLTAILALVLALAAQYVHANRETLATGDMFQRTAAPVYAALGRPVTPAWDIRGWQFESTSGSTDDADQHLTIYSRIVNKSATALPYPLVHVSLTDRWDEVIGSRILEPQEYLAGNGNVNRPVVAGEAFKAVVTVAAPSPEATGFKLNLCYPLSGARLRCAIEDFRD